jgi:hypothetical protein
VVVLGLGLLAKGEVVEPPPWYEWVSAVFVLAVVLAWLIWTSIEILSWAVGDGPRNREAAAGSDRLNEPAPCAVEGLQSLGRSAFLPDRYQSGRYCSRHMRQTHCTAVESIGSPNAAICV